MPYPVLCAAVGLRRCDGSDYKHLGDQHGSVSGGFHYKCREPQCFLSQWSEVRLAGGDWRRLASFGRIHVFIGYGHHEWQRIASVQFRDELYYDRERGSSMHDGEYFFASAVERYQLPTELHWHRGDFRPDCGIRGKVERLVYDHSRGANSGGGNV
jgi:hypothetical protein